MARASASASLPPALSPRAARTGTRAWDAYARFSTDEIGFRWIVQPGKDELRALGPLS
jgi:hypothetical protein